MANLGRWPMNGKYPKALEVFISVCIALLVWTIMAVGLYLLKTYHWLAPALAITAGITLSAVIIWSLLFQENSDPGY